MPEIQSGREISGILTNILRGIVPTATLWDGLIGYAFLDDGGVFTDDTIDANSVAANDVPLMPAVPVLNDAFYFGEGFNPTGVFNSLKINIGTAGVGGTIVWEYYTTGAAWVALSVSDGTNGFTTAGTNYVTWVVPANMNHVAVNGQDRYWVRARVLTAFAPIPLATQIWLGRYPISLANTTDGTLNTGAELGRVLLGAAGYLGYLLFDLGSIKTVMVGGNIGLWSSAGLLSVYTTSSGDNITYDTASLPLANVTYASELKSQLLAKILTGRYIKVGIYCAQAATASATVYEIMAYELAL